MAHHKRLIVLMAIAVIIAGYVLLPRSEEHVAMLARDGLYESAAKELSALRVAGDRQPYSLMQTYLLREKQGDRAGALDALEAYLSIRPDDPAARENEAEMLLQNGLLDRYLDSFARLVAARPLSDRIKQLIGLYRLHGRIDDELATLRAYAGTSMLGLAEIQRLGAILAERGDWLEAERWLDRADRLAPPDASAVRLLLLDVLIENNRIGEAFQRASAWIAEWHSAYLAGKLILRMARAGFEAQASDLIRRCIDEIPETAFEIAGLLTTKGHQELARQTLARWAEHEAAPTGEQLQAYVYASMQAEDAQGPFLKLAHMVHAGINPAAQARLAEELANAYGKLALAPVRSSLSTEALATRPIFAAELALFEANPDLARWYLIRTQPAQLSSEERAKWLILLGRVDPPTAVFDRLARLWQAGHLPPELVQPFADKALELGQVGMHDLIWRSLHSPIQQ